MDLKLKFLLWTHALIQRERERSRPIVLPIKWSTDQFSSVQSLSRVQLFATPWITAHQDSLSITNCQGLLKPMSIESVMPSSHLIICRPLLLLPPIPPSIRIFSNESTLHMRWTKYWSFSFRLATAKYMIHLVYRCSSLSPLSYFLWTFQSDSTEKWWLCSFRNVKKKKNLSNNFTWAFLVVFWIPTVL